MQLMLQLLHRPCLGMRRCSLALGACLLLLALPLGGEEAEEALSLVSWGDRLGFALVGSIIVLATLFALWGLSELLGSVFKQVAARAQRQAAAVSPASESSTQHPAVTPPASTAASGAAESEPIPVAVIAAAVAALEPRSHRLLAIRPNEYGSHWSRVGRHQQFENRRVRSNKP